MPDPRRPRPPRWGVRTLGFLTLAFACILVSNAMDRYTAVTLVGLLAGLIGALYCSVRGLAAAFSPGRVRLTGRPPDPRDR